jgi:hypothetical protein
MIHGVARPARMPLFGPGRTCAAGLIVLLLVAGCTTGAGRGRVQATTGGLVYPRVLFLTTGADGAGLLPSGANICLETFDGLGAFVEVADKSVLLDRGRLDSVRVIVAPTIAGYHDADRVFSMSFLDRASMVNLADWSRARTSAGTPSRAKTGWRPATCWTRANGRWPRCSATG